MFLIFFQKNTFYLCQYLTAMYTKPNLFLFNPTCEYAVANGNSSWQANQLLRKMESDLCNLPQYFATKNDVVLVTRKISSEFINHLSKLNLEMPQFEILSEAVKNPKIIQLQKNRLLPWGWSPAVHKILEPFKTNCSAEFKLSPVFNWKSNYREMYSKNLARHVLTQIIEKLQSPFLVDRNNIPVICKNKTDFEAAMARWGNVMVKAPWSSSGRGLQRITKTPVHEKVWAKVFGIVKEQGYAITEPYYEKVLDFAFQFEIYQGKVKFLGNSNFITDEKGQYQGNYLNGYGKNTLEETIGFVNKMQDLVLAELIQFLEKSIIANNYEGNFGVDLMVVNQDGKLKLHPCLEINLRQNMGLLALRMEKMLYNRAAAVFKIHYSPELLFKKFADEMSHEFPLKIKHGKIEKGFFALTDFYHNQQFGAYILV